jgi:hypothetical protein
MVLLGRPTEVTVKENFPSRTLSPVVAICGLTPTELSACDSKALVVRSKIPGSLPPVLTMMIKKRTKMAGGKAKRFFLNRGCVALVYGLCAVTWAGASGGDGIPTDGVVS